jgi:hypothetical protein
VSTRLVRWRCLRGSDYQGGGCSCTEFSKGCNIEVTVHAPRSKVYALQEARLNACMPFCTYEVAGFERHVVVYKVEDHVPDVMLFIR